MSVGIQNGAKQNKEDGMLIKEELRLVNLSDLLGIKDLKIPCYQRPYRWTEDSAKRLYRDIAGAMQKMRDKHITALRYRLGTVVLHKEEKEGAYQYYIVDGQQRITTLILLLKCLGYKVPNDLAYSALSRDAIIRNYCLFQQLVGNLSNEERKDYLKFLLENCEVVKLVVDKLAEAFQLFDSQNSRGKALAPHDLLKAYHLREMKGLPKGRVVDIIREWEGIKLEELQAFFNFNLYPLVNWYKGRDGLYFDKSRIGEFKGIQKKDSFNFSRYHLCAYTLMDEVNAWLKSINADRCEIFQLTQPVFAGEKFFEFVFHYWYLLAKIKAKINEYNKKGKIELLRRGQGDAYINYLLENVLMFYADRFNVDCITEPVYKKIFAWCYFLRLSLSAVRQESINKYALGMHYKNNDGGNIFEAVSEMADPMDILGVDVPVPNDEEGKKKVYKEIKDYCGWEKNEQ